MCDKTQANRSHQSGNAIHSIDFEYLTDNLYKMRSLVKFGNRKIPQSTMIFNIGTATNCPSRKLGLCKVGDACYALGAERQYPKALQYRLDQATLWDSCEASDLASMFLYEILKRTKTVSLIRFNESGDFKNQDDVDKMYDIAQMIYDKTLIKSYVYTARQDLTFQKDHEALTVNGSGFMVDNEFTVRPIEEPIYYEDFDYECKGNCNRCSLCSHSHGLRIMVRPHGNKRKQLSKRLEDGTPWTESDQ